MLTARGFWFLVTAFVMLALGLFAPQAGLLLSNLGLLRFGWAPQAGLLLSSLALLLWFGWSWFDFNMRRLIVRKRLQVRRQINDERGPVKTLWNGQTFEVREALVLESMVGMSYGVVTTHVPFDVDWVDGPVQVAGPLNAETPLEVVYQIRCQAAGVARFEGLRLQMIDPCGLFYLEEFIRSPQVLRVLPRLVDAENKAGRQETAQPLTAARRTPAASARLR